MKKVLNTISRFLFKIYSAKRIFTRKRVVIGSLLFHLVAIIISLFISGVCVNCAELPTFEPNWGEEPFEIEERMGEIVSQKEYRPFDNPKEFILSFINLYVPQLLMLILLIGAFHLGEELLGLVVWFIFYRKKKPFKIVWKKIEKKIKR